MKPFELLGETLTPNGSVIKLVRRDSEFLILADGAPLMTSRAHGSEDSLATFACQQLRALHQPSVLIGGLGMGFTLRAALDLLPSQAEVVVAELLPAVVEWNRGPLGPLAGHSLDDPRVHVEICDVAVSLSSHPARFDAVLLDVDNGPAAFTVPSNANLYSPKGLAAVHCALKNDGVLAVWAYRSDQEFPPRLRSAGFNVQVRRPRTGGKNRSGPHHTIFLAQKI